MATIDSLPDKINQSDPEFKVKEYDYIRDAIQEGVEDITTNNLNVTGTLDAASNSGTFNTITADATGSGDIPLTLILHDESTDSIFIDFRRESGGSESTVGRMTFDAANDELQLENIELAASTGGSMSFEDDRTLYFGTDNDYRARYDSTNTQLEIESADIDGAGTTGNILTITNGQQAVDFQATPTVTNTAVVLESRTLTGGSGINAIGDLSADRTISVDTSASLTWSSLQTFNGTMAVGQLGADPTTSANESHLYVSDGTADIQGSASDVVLTANDGTTEKFITLFDHSAGGIPNAALVNTDISLTAGNGLATDGDGVLTLGDAGETFSLDLSTSGGLKLTGTSPNQTLEVEPTDFAGLSLSDDGSDNLELASPSAVHVETVDPASQTYSASTRTTLQTYDAGTNGVLTPVRWEPADPSDADLVMVLEAEYHDGTTTDLVREAAGTVQSQENIFSGIPAADSGKEVKILRVIVEETAGADATEDIGATTTRFFAQSRGSGTVTVT